MLCLLTCEDAAEDRGTELTLRTAREMLETMKHRVLNMAYLAVDAGLRMTSEKYAAGGKLGVDDSDYWRGPLELVLVRSWMLL